MKALFYDTETSGLPDWSEPSESPNQPHIVEAAALVVDLDTRLVIGSMNMIVRPDGWEIPADVAALHGITTERALEVGSSEETVLGVLLGLWRGTDARIAHNESFDQRIVRIGIKRLLADEVVAEQWKMGRTECTQKLATPIMKLPPTAKMMAAKRFHPKSANLAEAYEFFTGKKLEGAHSAMVDVQACMEVYFAIKDAPAGSHAGAKTHRPLGHRAAYDAALKEEPPA